MPEQTNNFKQTWRVPLLLAILTISGLLSALLGTGIWRVIAWVALGVPVITIIFFIITKLKMKK